VDNSLPLSQFNNTNMSDILKEIGSNIRKLRLAKNLTQERLAFKADIHRAELGHIERGERNISILKLQKIARALDISIKDLLN
jgi:transcriptional regulator with XRE-family HTH domain